MARGRRFRTYRPLLERAAECAGRLGKWRFARRRVIRYGDGYGYAEVVEINGFGLMVYAVYQSLPAEPIMVVDPNIKRRAHAHELIVNRVNPADPFGAHTS